MMKVRILDRCEFCDGEAYVFVCEDVDARGETFDRYRPCEMCHGSGNQAKWVGLREFANLVERATSFEPDYAALAQEQPISQYLDSRDAYPLFDRSSSLIIPDH
jgi:RecJ-like exonuclease